MRRMRVVLATSMASVLVALAAPAASGASTLDQVLQAVKSSLAIKSIPSGLLPSLSSVANNGSSPLVNSAGLIKHDCDPYWVRSQATHPVPCIFGDTKATKTVVMWGDSNVGNWIPALNALYLHLGYRLDVFAFIGCDSSFKPETSTQVGFPGQWQLCNEWHAALPGVVHKLDPVELIEASTMLGRFGNTTFNDTWVKDMALAFNLMSVAGTIRVEMQTIPSRKVSPISCLESNPNDLPACATWVGTPGGEYEVVKQRDEEIATESKAILIPTWQLLCSNGTCPPVIGKDLALVDDDHLSTPYAAYISQAIATEFSTLKALPHATH